MSARTKQLLALAGGAFGALGIKDDPNGELASKALSPTVPTSESMATEHFMTNSQSEALIDLTVSQSEWLSMATVKMMNQRAGNIPRVVINDVVTEGVSENGGRTIATHPDTSEKAYLCKKFQATWFMTLESISEAAASGEANFDGKIRGAFAKAMGNDMARVALNGDTSLGTSTRMDRLLRQHDGWLKIAREEANYSTTTRGSAWSAGVYPSMQSQMPDKFSDDKDLRWLHGRRLDESYTQFAQGLGDGSALRDRALLERTRFRPMGIDTVIVPQWPADQGFSSLNGSASDPDLVTDDGDGTITLRVNTLFGGYSASHAGRRVKVTFNATGQSETLTVKDVGSNLVINSTGSLGQGTISTTVGAYTLDLADTTGIMLTNPRNLFVVLCRNIRAYRKYEQESERHRIDVYYEAAFGIFEPDAVVLQEGIIPTSTVFGS